MGQNRVRNAFIGGIVTFLIAMGAAIPAFGIFIGPIFTFGGGLVGGAIAAYLQREGGRSGLAVGAIGGFIGGAIAAVIGTIVGTALNVWLVGGSPSGQSIETWVWIVYAVIGIVSGMAFTTIGGTIGGGVVGYLAGTPDEA